jgi:uncharacterized membrane protein YcaP (DUF421 family)
MLSKDLVILTVRSLFFYVLIRITVYGLMSKNKKMQLLVMDLALIIMIVQLAVVSLALPNQPLIWSLIPIISILGLHILLLFTFRPPAVKPKERAPAQLWHQFADVEVAALDSFPQGEAVFDLPMPLIVDGEVFDKNLNKLGKTRFWLKNEVQRFGVKRFKEVSYCSMDSKGNFYLDKK